MPAACNGSTPNVASAAAPLSSWRRCDLRACVIALYLRMAVSIQIATAARQAQAHAEGNHQHRRDVPAVDRLVPDRLQSQRHIFSRTAKQGIGDRIGKSDTER